MRRRRRIKRLLWVDVFPPSVRRRLLPSHAALARSVVDAAAAPPTPDGGNFMEGGTRTTAAAIDVLTILIKCQRITGLIIIQCGSVLLLFITVIIGDGGC